MVIDNAIHSQSADTLDLVKAFVVLSILYINRVVISSAELLGINVLSRDVYINRFLNNDAIIVNTDVEDKDLTVNKVISKDIDRRQ